ncbi:hypothetical protein BD414DRAFT_278178 [Trametes punicea]|nr:hypothetical protein BD414DRAFT_278178 [Trametes punicea]
MAALRIVPPALPCDNRTWRLLAGLWRSSGTDWGVATASSRGLFNARPYSRVGPRIAQVIRITKRRPALRSHNPDIRARPSNAEDQASWAHVFSEAPGSSAFRAMVYRAVAMLYCICASGSCVRMGMGLRAVGARQPR